MPGPGTRRQESSNSNQNNIFIFHETKGVQRSNDLQNKKKTNFNEHKYHTNHDKQNVQYAQVP